MIRKKTVLTGCAGLAVGGLLGLSGLAWAANTNGGTLTLNAGISENLRCTGGGHLTNSSVGFSTETVNCAPASTTTTTAPSTTTVPSTTTTPPNTTPPTTSPPTTTGGGGNPQCTSNPQGSLGPYDYPGIFNSNGFNTYVANNMWGANPGSTQTVCGTSPGSWTMDANMVPVDYTGVQTYPDVQQLMNDYSGADTWNGPGALTDTPIADLHTLSSTYSIVNPPASQGDWEAAYDIWTSSGELMIWTTYSTERINNNGATVENPNVVIGGQSFTDMNYQGGLPQMVLNSNSPSGTIDILGVLHYWQSQGELAANATIGQLDYGWEMCNTAGTTLHFAVNGYTLSGS